MNEATFITPVTEEERNAIKEKSAHALPDSPRDYRMKAGQVKPAFWKPLVHGDGSVAALIDRVISQANEALGKGVVSLSYDPDAGTATVTFGSGSSRQIEMPKRGPQGDPGVSPTVGCESVDGGYLITLTDINGERSFLLPKGARGEPGKPFEIAKLYESVAQMETGFKEDDVPPGGFVLIATGSVENEDNAKLYVKGETSYQYLCDLSGATGIRGPAGASIDSFDQTATSGNKDTYTVTLTDGRTFEYTVTNGKDGDDGVGISDAYIQNGSLVLKLTNGEQLHSTLGGMATTSELEAALTAAKAYTDEELAKFNFVKIVDSLPEKGLPNSIYLVPKTDTGTQDLFDEYLWADRAWEYVDTKHVAVDLTGYVQKEDGKGLSANDLTDALKANYDAAYTHSVSTHTVSKGGTGKTTHTTNAVLTGNGTGAVKNVATKSGAFYATGTNGAPQFGTLPVAQGGTGATTAKSARTNLGITPNNIGAANAEHTHDASDIASGAISITNGGTGATTALGALQNLGFCKASLSADIGTTSGQTYENWIDKALQHIANTVPLDGSCMPYFFNLGWQNVAFGSCIAFSSHGETRTALIFQSHETIGVRAYYWTATWAAQKIGINGSGWKQIAFQ